MGVVECVSVFMKEVELQTYSVDASQTWNKQVEEELGQCSLLPRPRPAFHHLQYGKAVDFSFMCGKSMGTRLEAVRDQMNELLNYIGDSLGV